MVVRKYQELIAWQKAIALVTQIYQATSNFPRQEIYGLTSQIRRAAVSIPSNIAEGQVGFPAASSPIFLDRLAVRCLSSKPNSLSPEIWNTSLLITVKNS